MGRFSPLLLPYPTNVLDDIADRIAHRTAPLFTRSRAMDGGGDLHNGPRWVGLDEGDDHLTPSRLSFQRGLLSC